MRPFVVLSIALALVACEDSTRKEARALVSAVERVDRAADADKASALRDLAGLACTDPDVCAAKEACVSANDATLKAASIKRDVEARLTDLQAGRLAPDAGAARELPGKLDDAERLLKEGKAASDACSARLARVRAKHPL